MSPTRKQEKSVIMSLGKWGLLGLGRHRSKHINAHVHPSEMGVKAGATEGPKIKGVNFQRSPQEGCGWEHGATVLRVRTWLQLNPTLLFPALAGDREPQTSVPSRRAASPCRRPRWNRAPPRAVPVPHPPPGPGRPWRRHRFRRPRRRLQQRSGCGPRQALGVSPEGEPEGEPRGAGAGPAPPRPCHSQRAGGRGRAAPRPPPPPPWSPPP